jgi:hypothetical protein
MGSHHGLICRDHRDRNHCSDGSGRQEQRHALLQAGAMHDVMQQVVGEAFEKCGCAQAQVADCSVHPRSLRARRSLQRMRLPAAASVGFTGGLCTGRIICTSTTPAGRDAAARAESNADCHVLGCLVGGMLPYAPVCRHLPGLCRQQTCTNLLLHAHFGG